MKPGAYENWPMHHLFDTAESLVTRVAQEYWEYKYDISLDSLLHLERRH